MADRLAAARRGRFVGREAEIELFRSALLAETPPFAVLHLYGPGGVGKTTLLREYARIAAESGRPIVRLDGRNLDPTPSSFLLALHQAMGVEEAGVHSAIVEWPATGVLLIDTYETLAPLDGWLRETFLPQLPGQSLVVIAGRNTPASAWRTDIDWADLTRMVLLHNLRPEESQTYLTVRGVPDDRHAHVLAFTHGHPLALSLVADVLGEANSFTLFNPQEQPDVVRLLLERFMQDAPSAHHRLALEVCVLAWATTEALLAEIVGMDKAPELFDWLRHLSFVEQGPRGLFPHDLAREVLDADLRWRNPSGRQQLISRLILVLYSWLQQAGGVEMQHIFADILYLARHSPIIKPYFDWSAMHSGYAEPASREDAAAIVEMVQRHEGEASAQIARYWLRRQPQAFRIFRSFGDESVGFVANLALDEESSEDLAADPAIAALWRYVRRYGPIRPGEEVACLRFWMSREAYQSASPATNLAAVSTALYWMTRPNLAWSFAATAYYDFMELHFTGINFRRSPEADYVVDGRRYGVFTRDWRVESVSAWLAVKADRYSRTELNLEEMRAALPPQLAVLSQPEFAEAVRQGLRSYTRPDSLAANPLMRSRTVAKRAESGVSPATLQALLCEAAETLTANPKDQKLYRALWHTYFEPAPTQERAAELLDLPFSTYRYHLAHGVDRIVDWLWQRELHS
jgi:hypothetical protein